MTRFIFGRMIINDEKTCDEKNKNGTQARAIFCLNAFSPSSTWLLLSKTDILRLKFGMRSDNLPPHITISKSDLSTAHKAISSHIDKLAAKLEKEKTSPKRHAPAIRLKTRSQDT